MASHALAQCEQAKLTASDAAREQYFGRAVSISGDVAVIGAEGDAHAGFQSGSAYVFRRIGSTWVQEQKLIASDAFESDQFGNAVAISGNTAMITAVGADMLGYAGNTGAVYVFGWDGAHWVEQQKLLASDSLDGWQLGWSIALNGDFAAVGQVGDSFAGASEAGAVYVFRWNGGSWVQEQKLVPPDLGPFDHFGWSVAATENVIVGGTTAGAAYVFRWNGSSWVQEQKLTPGDGPPSDAFGWSVGIASNALAVGAPAHSGAFVHSGMAYVYRFNGSTWGDEQELPPPAEVQYGGFGSSVAAGGGNLLIAPVRLGATQPGTWSVYLYRLVEGQWIHAGVLAAPDAAGEFGTAVSLARTIRRRGRLGKRRCLSPGPVL